MGNPRVFLKLHNVLSQPAAFHQVTRSCTVHSFQPPFPIPASKMWLQSFLVTSFLALYTGGLLHRRFISGHPYLQLNLLQLTALEARVYKRTPVPYIYSSRVLQALAGPGPEPCSSCCLAWISHTQLRALPFIFLSVLDADIFATPAWPNHNIYEQLTAVTMGRLCHYYRKPAPASEASGFSVVIFLGTLNS